MLLYIKDIKRFVYHCSGVDSESSLQKSGSKSVILDIVKRTDGMNYSFKLVEFCISATFSISTPLQQILFFFREATSVVHHFTTPTVDSRAIRKNWEIAPGVRLPLAMYTKSVAAKNPLKSVFVNEEGVEVTFLFSYVDIYDVSVKRYFQMHRQSRFLTTVKTEDSTTDSNGSQFKDLSAKEKRIQG